MANATVGDLDESETGRGGYLYKLSNPASFLWTMAIFLIIGIFVIAYVTFLKVEEA